jgi:hypothetical protein
MFLYEYYQFILYKASNNSQVAGFEASDSADLSKEVFCTPLLIQLSDRQKFKKIEKPNLASVFLKLFFLLSSRLHIYLIFK